MKVLVLSAGGAFGAYQIGAWLALEERGWHPDLIVGASIGAVNGLAISHGARGEDLLDLWQRAPDAVGGRNGVPPCRGIERFSLGKRTPLFRSWIKHVFSEWSHRPRKCDFQVTLTEWPSCAVRVVKDPAIGLPHVVATCAVPGVMSPVRIGRKVYLDGGTFSPLPLLPAIHAGATEIVAVDVLAASPCKTIRWARRVGTTVRNFVRREASEVTAQQLAEIRLHRIQSVRPLGSLEDCFAWDANQIDEMAAAGYRDAQALLPAKLTGSAEPVRREAVPEGALAPGSVNGSGVFHKSSHSSALGSSPESPRLRTG